MTRVDRKFEQGLGWVKKCLRVYGVSVTFMSTGYMYHEYDWRLNDDFDINQRRRRLTRNIRTAMSGQLAVVCQRVEADTFPACLMHIS